MPSLSVYLDDETIAAVQAGAAAEGVSLSQYVANAIAQKQGIEVQDVGWPEGYWESVYGALKDDDFEVPPDEPFNPDEPDWN